jgi:hypothetical protein
MILAAARALAAHDFSGCVHAAGIAWMLAGVGLVFNFPCADMDLAALRAGA